MIEIFNVNKYFEEKHVLKDVSLKVDKGSIYGLVGANGAGKSTLIKAIMGVYKPESGCIKINGEEPFDNASIKQIVGYVPDEENYFTSYKVKDILKFYTMAYKNFNIKRFHELNNLMGIPENTYTRKLSKGMNMRLSIMLNLAIEPQVLVMDEPTSGLDPIVKKEILNLIVDEAAKGTSILISSHNLNDLERICDSIGILDKGKIQSSETVENMKTNIRKLQVVFKSEPPKDIESWKEIISVSNIGKVYTIITSEYTEELIEKLKSSGILFHEEVSLSLEDMFIYSVGGDKNHEKVF